MLGTRLTHNAARRVITGAIVASLASAPVAVAQQTGPTPDVPTQQNVPVFARTQPSEPKLDLRGAPQSSLPELGDPSQTLLSAAQERKLGETIMYQVRASGYLYDPEVNGYLNELGNRLVTAVPGAPFDFEFFAMADPTINAFALPGGFVGVNTGLILLAQSESELASVLGHEITHV